MFRSQWREFPSAPCLAKTKNWWDLASRCCWNRARSWHAFELVSFLVGLRTYQHPDNISEKPVSYLRRCESLKSSESKDRALWIFISVLVGGDWLVLRIDCFTTGKKVRGTPWGGLSGAWRFGEKKNILLLSVIETNFQLVQFAT